MQKKKKEKSQNSRKQCKLLLLQGFYLKLKSIIFIIFTLFSSIEKNLIGQSAPLRLNINKPLSFNHKIIPINKVNIQKIISSKFVNWGIQPKNKKSSINILNVWKTYEKKRDVIVGVVDTGIDPHHIFLKDNLYAIGPHGTKNYGMDFSKNNKNFKRPHDSHGHGTHISGIIKSILPSVKLLTLKYYNRRASGKENLSSTIKSLKYAIDNNVDIINYSGGGPYPDREEFNILKIAEKKGILIIVAAGNNNRSNIDLKKSAYYPASYKLNNIISVMSHDQNLKLLPSSNFGKKTVHIAAPGKRIKSSLPNNRAGFLTGTSQATAFVSGVAAILKSQFIDLSTKQIKNIIIKSATKEISFLNKCVSGGRLNADAAYKMAIKTSRYNKDKMKFAKSKSSKKSTQGRAPANTKD